MAIIENQVSIPICLAEEFVGITFNNDRITVSMMKANIAVNMVSTN